MAQRPSTSALQAIVDVFFWVPLPPPYSGPEVGSALLIEELRRRIPDIVVGNATCRTSNMAKGRFDRNGVLAFVRSYTKFVALLLRSQRRVLYMVIAPGEIGFIRDMVLIWTAAIAGKRVVVHLRGGNYANFYRSASTALRFLIRRTWALASRAIVQSDRLTSLLADCAPTVPISVLPNGLPIPPTAPQCPPTAELRPTTTFLFVGYLSYTKGFYDLMLAYKGLHARYGNRVELLFAGEQPQHSVQLATFLSGDNKAYYLEHLSEIEAAIGAFVADAPAYNANYLGVVSGAAKQAAFDRADILVLPSYMEGFSMAILEAMFSGPAIVTTGVGSNPDIIAHGVNGFLVDVGEPKALEETLGGLVENPRLSQAMGGTNAKEAQSKYRLDAVVDTFVGILALA